MSHTTHDDDAMPVVDYGTAPVSYVNGLARVDVMGEDALFALWAQRTTMLDGRIIRTREVVLNVVMPVAAVGPGVGDLAAVHQDMARGGLDEARHHVQERGLATAGGPEETGEAVL